MVWLFFFDITLVGAYKKNALTKFNIVYVANKSVLTIANSASKPANAETSVDKLCKHHKNTNSEQQSAGV